MHDSPQALATLVRGVQKCFFLAPTCNALPPHSTGWFVFCCGTWTVRHACGRKKAVQRPGHTHTVRFCADHSSIGWAANQQQWRTKEEEENSNSQAPFRELPSLSVPKALEAPTTHTHTHTHTHSTLALATVSLRRCCRRRRTVGWKTVVSPAKTGQASADASHSAVQSHPSI
jgi:hypothetical protein